MNGVVFLLVLGMGAVIGWTLACIFDDGVDATLRDFYEGEGGRWR